MVCSESGVCDRGLTSQKQNEHRPRPCKGSSCPQMALGSGYIETLCCYSIRGSWALGTRDDAVSSVPLETGFWGAALSVPSPQGQQDGWRLWHQGGPGPTACKGHLKRGQDRWGQAGIKLLLSSPCSPNAWPFSSSGLPGKQFTLLGSAQGSPPLGCWVCCWWTLRKREKENGIHTSQGSRLCKTRY